MLVIALVIATAAIFAALGYLFARHRAGSHDRRHSDEQNSLRTNLRIAEEQREQARTRAEELRAERDQAQQSQRERESAWSELTTRLNAVSEERGRLETEGKAAGEALRKARSEAEGLQKSYENGQRRIQELEGALVAAGKGKAALEAVIVEHKARAGDDRAELEKLRTERAELEKRQAEVAAAQKKLEQVQEEHNRIQAEQFKSAVAEVVSASQEKLTAAADEKLGATAKAVGDRLQEFDRHIRDLEGRRTSGEARLEQHIRSLVEESGRGRAQTEALVKVLRKPQVRGQWGEMHLKKTVELANLREHVDFNVQTTVAGEEGDLRPDMTINLVNGRTVVVDSKVSLDAFMNALEADDAEHDRHMKEHANQVRKHVDRLASKEYFTKVAGSPDFVIMFLPNEALLQAALDKRPDLHEYALRKGVMVTTPTTLIPVLRIIALSWEEEKVRENAEAIQKLGRDIYERLSVLGGHLSTLGKHLDSSVDYYNRTIGSLERNVLPAARRFSTLGVSSNKDLPNMEPKDSMSRTLKATELTGAAAAEAVAAAVDAVATRDESVKSRAEVPEPGSID